MSLINIPKYISIGLIVKILSMRVDVLSVYTKQAIEQQKEMGIRERNIKLSPQ